MINTRAISPPPSSPTPRIMGGVLVADDLRSCQARVLPATQFPWRGHTLQLAGGLTAAPTMMRVLEQMAAVRVGAKPDADWYVAFGRAMKQAYQERLGTARRRRIRWQRKPAPRI